MKALCGCGECVSCRKRAYMRVYNAKPGQREKARVYYREYRRNRSDEDKKKYKRSNRQGSWDKQGIIGAEIFDAVVLHQGNVCAICGSGTPRRKGDWCADHCHETGQFRGALCFRCNIWLGAYERFLKDERVQEYLRNPPADIVRRAR